MDTLFLCLSTLSAGIFSLLIFAHFILKATIKPAGLNRAPDVDGAWPIIGHLPLMMGSKLPHRTLGSIADKYGPIFTIRLGVHRSVVVSSAELARECFTTNDVAISSRPKTFATKLFGYNDAMFSFAPHGPYWREMRKITTMELLSNRRIELQRRVRVSEVDSMMKALYKLWSELGEESRAEGLKVELKQWFGNLTLRIILRIVAGKYFGSCAEKDEKEIRRCQKAVREAFRLIGLFVVGDALPFLGWLDIGGHEKAIRKVADELDDILRGWLEEHKRKRASGDQVHHNDFVDVMLTLLDGANLSADFDVDTINKATCLTLITGGSDTSMVTLTWALSLLLNNPCVLKKAREELDDKIGKDRTVDESDIGKLVYLQAIIKETLRLHPPGPLSGIREVTQDCTISGYHVAKGTRLIVNVGKIQRDPKHWPNPDDFKPERFLAAAQKGDIDVMGQHFELLPFGGGRRMCPGTNFALQVVHLVLARFLQAFDVSKPSNEPVDMSETFGMSTVKTRPLEVLVIPRLPSSLYK